jgi:cation transport regulator ChaB
MTDQPPHRMVRAITVRVSCLVHGTAAITGSVSFSNLGYGRSYQDHNTADCTKCGSSDWLHLLIAEDDYLEVPADEVREAMMAALQAEYAASQDSTDDDAEDEENSRDEADREPKAEHVSSAATVFGLFMDRPRIGGARG